MCSDYTVWNTSVLSVVVAGNATLVVETSSCPEEGCQGLTPEVSTVAAFKWSDNASWVAQNASVPCQHVPTAMNGNRMCSAEYPCGENGCADVIIWDGWTVRAKERPRRHRARRSKATHTVDTPRALSNTPLFQRMASS